MGATAIIVVKGTETVVIYIYLSASDIFTIESSENLIYILNNFNIFQQT
jgi:hypothetical protein